MTIKEIKSAYSAEKRNAEKLEPWVYILTRPLSFPAAWLCMKMGLSATAVTYISLVFIVIGGTLLCTSNYIMHIAGTLAFTIWLILDCADGNIARYKKSFSAYGEFVDALGGYLINAVIFPVMAIATLHYNRFDLPEVWIISAGFLSALLNLLSRLLYQKKLNLMGSENKNIKPADNQKSWLIRASQAIASVSGFMLPFSTLAIIFRLPESFIAFYLPVNVMMFLYSMAKLMKKQDS